MTIAAPPGAPDGNIPIVAASPIPGPRPAAPVRRAARALLALLGWRVEVVWPPVAKCVIVVYPHTSNWDFVVGYLAKVAAGLPASWVGKHTLFRWPFAGLFRRMGGIPADRRHPSGLVAQLVAEIERRPWMWLAIAPEGTRAYTDHWKSGFYRVALAAKIPLGLAFIDWGARVVGLSTYLTLTGDEAADVARLREVYAGRSGRHPAQASAIRLHPE